MRIGIDLGGTNIRVARVENGMIVAKVTASCPAKEDEQTVLHALEKLIGQLICPEVESIGIGVPSIVDSKEGVVYNVANIPAWKEVPLKQLLEARFGIPVYVNNDSNCFALGVKNFGEGKPYSDMVGITLGTGVGSGIVINGRLYNGRNTGAGEIGSLPYLEHDFEHYCSSSFFVRYYGLTGKEAGSKAAEGDVRALGIWTEFGTHLGNLMKAVLFTYDPEAIIIGGGIASAFRYYEQAMWKVLHTFPYLETVKNLQIIVSQRGDAALLGASAL